MSRDPYNIVADVVKCAMWFLRAENLLFERLPGHGPSSYIMPMHEIEKELASSACAFRQFHEEYRRNVAELRPRPFTLSLRDAIDELPEMIEMRLRRWSWEFVLADDGMKQVNERIRAYTETKWHAVLDAARSRAKARKKFERHRGDDDLADVADRLEIAPTLTPEEGDRLLWPRHGEWYATPALAETTPSVSTQEHGELADAIDELSRLFRRLESPKQQRVYSKLTMRVGEHSDKLPNLDHGLDLNAAKNESDARTSDTLAEAPKKPRITKEKIALYRKIVWPWMR